MGHQDRQPLRHSMSSTSSRQAPLTQTTYTPREAYDLLRKLQETTIAALGTSNKTMDSSNSYGGSSSKDTSPYDKSKAYDQSAIFDGLLPRIETRGQSKHSSKNSSGKKKESKSSSQQYVCSTNSQATGADGFHNS
ncbi:hypothetical protein CI238_02468 [Colletotrichum incanum]|uniref:Uncharacterized protein n=1 Tax=Colletotrichum incanum TaxID=1573173 RepID=A0A161VL70_COLIC|nr:hypothetical protein CI238_02468 [Colletotrichum incanum]OHW96619.1 hypothetical protein CSPAE12_04654 [Colletotrichum incanum]